MAFTLMIFIALTGAAILGFVWAWYKQGWNVEMIKKEMESMRNQSAEKDAKITTLQNEINTQKLTIENAQKQSQKAESELIELQTSLRVLEGEVQVLEREKRILANDNALLEEELRSNIKEIEVIREVPFEDESGHSSDHSNKLTDERIENAKRLVFAFKKGVSENQNASAEEG